MEKSSHWLALGLTMGIGCGAEFPPTDLDTTACTSPSKPTHTPFLTRHLNVLPKISQPPLAWSSADQRNQEIFIATRPAANTPKPPRWEQARLDVPFDTASVMATFSRTIHLPLNPNTHPKVASLLASANIDLWETITEAKKKYKTKRPFLTNPGEICENRTDHLEKSPDFPSGHAAIGRLYALILADLFPAQTNAIYRRGITYGESRVICGSHSLSAVQAGVKVAEQVMDELKRTAAYKTALNAARLEVSSNSKTPIPECTSEDALVESPLLRE